MKTNNRMVIYQMLPRLFGNTNTTRKTDGTIDENGVGKFSSITTKALDAIRKLGCTHVWYTGVIEHATKTDYSRFGIPNDPAPVIKGNAGSPYAIKDYYDVDPDLADDVMSRMEEFEALVKRTHARKLGVIIDFVPNHVARLYHSDAKPQGVEELGEGDNSDVAFSPTNNFYYLPQQPFRGVNIPTCGDDGYYEFPAKATGNDCFSPTPSINDWYETVKLNYGKDYLNYGSCHFDPIPDTWSKMLHILLFWADKGVDAFRCDMAEMVPVEFWQWVIPQVKAAHPHLLFIAEVYNPAEYRNYTINGQFDYLYDKVGLYDTLKRVVRGEESASAITSCWQQLGESPPSMLNFLENHDEQRIASPFFAGDPIKALPALVLSATISTSPYMIYAGQELGEAGMDAEGFSGTDGRTSIFDYWSVDTLCRWNNNGAFTLAKLTTAEKQLRAFYCRLLTLCNSEAALREGGMYDIMYANYDNSLFNGHKLFAYLRAYQGELCLIVVNFDSIDHTPAVIIPAHAFDWLNIKTSPDAEWIELLSQQRVYQPLLPSTPIVLNVAANSAVIFKTTGSIISIT